MKIDSSMIGMESARRYSSVTKMGVRANLAGSASLQGNDFKNSPFADLLGAGADRQSPWEEDLGLAKGNNLAEGEEVQTDHFLYKSQSVHKNVSSVSEKKTMQSIREMCVLYLIRWLYATQYIGHGGQESSPANDYAQNSVQNYLARNGMADAGTSFYTAGADTSMYYSYSESEQTQYRTQGVVRTSDGREITFGLNLSMSRSFRQQYEYRMPAQMTDPLVINLDTEMTELSDQKFEFDLDADGVTEHISMLGRGSGYLALDKNGDGVINDGSELFGTKSGDGFADLAAYDTDGNGWIDESDEIFDKLLIWAKDENGNDELYTLKESGVGAICLQRAETDFSLHSLKNNQINGRIRSTGIFLYENGNVGTLQQLDLAQ